MKLDNEIKNIISNVISNMHIISNASSELIDIEKLVSRLFKDYSSSPDTLINYVFELIEFINHKLNHNSDFYRRTQETILDEKLFKVNANKICRHFLLASLIKPCIMHTEHFSVDVFSIENAHKLMELHIEICIESHYMIREIQASFLHHIKIILSSRSMSEESSELMLTSMNLKYVGLTVYFELLAATLKMYYNYSDQYKHHGFILNIIDIYSSISIIYKLMKLYSMLPEQDAMRNIDVKLFVSLDPDYYDFIEAFYSQLSNEFQKQSDRSQLDNLKGMHNIIVRGEDTENYKTLFELFQHYYPNLKVASLEHLSDDKVLNKEKISEILISTLDSETTAKRLSDRASLNIAHVIKYFPEKIKSMTRKEICTSIGIFEIVKEDVLLLSNAMVPSICQYLEDHIRLAKDYLAKYDAAKKQRQIEKRRRVKKARRAKKAMNELIEAEKRRISKIVECKTQMVTHQSLAAYQPKLTDAKNVELPWSIAIYQPVNKKTVSRQLDILRVYRYNFSHQFLLQKYYDIWCFLSDTSHRSKILDVTQNALTLMLISLSKLKTKRKLTENDKNKIKDLFQKIDEITSKTVHRDVAHANEMLLILKLVQSRRLIIDAEFLLREASINAVKKIDNLLKKAEVTINSASLITETQCKIYHDETTETIQDIQAIRYVLKNKEIDCKSERQTVASNVKTLKKPNYKNSEVIQPEIKQKQLKTAHYSPQFRQIWVYQRAIRTHGRVVISQHAKNIQQQFQFLQSALTSAKLPQQKSHHMQLLCSKLNTLLSNYSRVLGNSISTPAQSQSSRSTGSINQILQKLCHFFIKGYLSTEYELINAILPCLMCDDSILIEKQSKLIANLNNSLIIALKKHGLTEKDVAFYITGSTLDKFHPNFKPQTKSEVALSDLDLTICLLTIPAQNKLDQVVLDFKTQLPNQATHAFVHKKVWNMYQCHNVRIDGIDIDLTIKCAIKGQEHSNTFEHELAFNIAEQALSLTNQAISYQEVFSKASHRQFEISEITASKFQPYTVSFIIKKSIQYISKYGLTPGPRTKQYFGTIFTNNCLLSQAMKLLLDKYVHKNGNINVYHALLQYPLPIIFDNIEYNVSLSYIISLWLPPSGPVITLKYQPTNITSSDTKASSKDIRDHSSVDRKRGSLRNTRKLF